MIEQPEGDFCVGLEPMTIKVAFSESSRCFQMAALRSFTISVESNRLISRYAPSLLYESTGTYLIFHE